MKHQVLHDISDDITDMEGGGGTKDAKVFNTMAWVTNDSMSMCRHGHRTLYITSFGLRSLSVSVVVTVNLILSLSLY